MRSLYEKLKNEQGYSLLLALFLFVLLTVLVFAIQGVSSNTLKTSSKERLSQSAYYIAEAGLVEKREVLKEQISDAYEKAVEEFTIKANSNPSNIANIDFKQIFKNHLQSVVDTSSKTFNNFEKQFSHSPEAKVTIDEKEAGDEIIYTIQSTGTIDNSERTAQQEIRVNLNSISANYLQGTGFSVIAKNTITYGYYNIHQNVQGKLASATEHKINIIGWKEKDLYAEYAPDVYDNLINSFQPQLQFDSAKFENMQYQKISSPLVNGDNLEATWNTHNNKTLKLDHHAKLNNFKLTSNITFNIDVGDTEKVLYVNNLIFDGTLNILGDGSLTIFVKDNLNFNYSNINVNGNPNKINIYYAGSKELTIANGLKMSGNIYIKQANLKFSGGAGFKGSLFSGGTGNVVINGGTVSKDVTFVMPNYDFEINNGAHVYGSILCKSIKVDGDARIYSHSDGGLGGGKVDIQTQNPLMLKPIVEK